MDTRRCTNGNRPLCLWASPRSSSTAFDKMMRQRGDHKVFTEPFSYPYYFGPERVYTHFNEEYPDRSFSSVLSDVLLESKKKPVFVKEIAYQIGPLIKDKSVVLSFKGSLLIRHPGWVVPSFQRVWPEYFSEGMVSFQALHDIFSIIKNADENVLVIDAHDLRNHPEKVVAAWCENMNIPVRLDALKWDKGMPDEWKTWSQWFGTTSESTGFIPVTNKDFPPMTEELARIVDANRSLYYSLEAQKLQV
ncbi:P-loop containing nucleoside triphosphate hydrolase [Gracilaria domingensis]|nr:P-loop containing nucleoside triphosphate hydrolase [Gracilaria domingensis]